MLTKDREVLLNRLVGWVVPVAHVNDTKPIVRLGLRPLHHPGNRALLGPFPHETQRFRVTHMKSVRQGFESANRLDEVVLQALGEQQGCRFQDSLSSMI
jgi:hypothetical protein